MPDFRGGPPPEQQFGDQVQPGLLQMAQSAVGGGGQNNWAPQWVTDMWNSTPADSTRPSDRSGEARVPPLRRDRAFPFLVSAQDTQGEGLHNERLRHVTAFARLRRVRRGVDADSKRPPFLRRSKLH